MADTDAPGMAQRLRAVLPGGWFPDVAPVLTGLLTGLGSCFSWLFDLIAYTALQARIATATDVFLDIIGLDFLGTRIVRKAGQSDDSWRTRIQQEILAPKATRPAMMQRLTALTGRAPIIFEPAMPLDTGGYSVGGVGYGVAGGYGNLDLPFQCFITAYRPRGGGIASVAAYGNAGSFLFGAGGYGVGAIEYADMSMVQGAVTDDDINAAVASCASVATIPWIRISN